MRWRICVFAAMVVALACAGRVRGQRAQGNDNAAASNALIAQLQTAIQNRQWQPAADLAKQLIELNPDRWTYRQSLGSAQLNLGQYDDALKTLDAGIKLAQAELNAKAPESDPIKLKAGIVMMFTSEGNAYLKLKKNDLAIAAYTKAAELDPNPGTAYFNICAVQYNTGNTEGAMAACDKAIAADPKKADAYFIKGSLLIAASTTDANGKVIAPPGTVEALKKYLELAPDGQHARDVKDMLEYVGVKQ
ncbi:MAG TPA: tetratricopeptide repeat protein [Candidatus Acidoferrales bacterium]|jgi:tetratricopeptide (TPR) repeat protein|nr:tetratricopeptide repeat protein [Candidatus Acidoferrales bacterium]